MTTRVYRYACQATFENAELVSRQFALAHEYRNGLVAIERARRGAVRAVEDDTAEVRAAIEVVVGATKSMRREAMKLLREARKLARDAAADELERIEALNRSIVKDAYNLYGDRGLAWGTRLRIAAAADAARREPLYGDDGHSPLVPHFHRWDGSGTCVVQLQHGLPVSDLLRGGDTRAAIERGVDMRAPTRAGTIMSRKGGLTDAVLSLRIGSDGRAPVWARWPITTTHRALPNEGRVTWIAATCNRAGQWSCEITVTGITDRSDVASSERRGAIAVEVCWSDRGSDGICAATWLDSDGKRGSVIVPPRVVGALRKAHDIRSLRDLSIGDQHAVDGRLLRAGIRTTLGRSLQATSDPLPPWLARARDTVAYWKSPGAFRALAQRWRRERCDAAREAYDLLQEWELRDAHLLNYEAGARRGGLKTRDQLYHTMALDWSGRYDQVIVDNRNLSREARWGEDSDVRFLTAPSDLRNALRNAFGWRAVELPHTSKDVDADGDPIEFCERAIAAYLAGTARAVKIEKDPAEIAGGAWARRKAKKRAKVDAVGAARESVGKCAE